MKKVPVTRKSKLVLNDIEGFIVREVTPFGTSAKVSCPKEFLGRKAYLVFVKDES